MTASHSGGATASSQPQGANAGAPTMNYTDS